MGKIETNILITGGLGYVGGRVADFLKSKRPGSKIFLTTRKGGDYPAWAKDFKILRMDLLKEDSIARAVKGRGIGLIIHLAALNEGDSKKDLALAFKVNVEGTRRLLEHASANKVNRFIYLSTFHVYGKTDAPLVTEESATRPVSAYAITHRAAEDVVNYFRHNCGMETLILRLSNGYGYPMDSGIGRWELVFNDLCRQAVTTGKIILKSSGRQYRDFISLYDVARAIGHFIFTAEWTDGLYNLGGGRSITILDAARRIADVYAARCGRKIMIKAKPAGGKEAPPGPFTYSIKKLKNTGFRPAGDMNTEISRTMDICEI